MKLKALNAARIRFFYSLVVPAFFSMGISTCSQVQPPKPYGNQLKTKQNKNNSTAPASNAPPSGGPVQQFKVSGEAAKKLYRLLKVAGKNSGNQTLKTGAQYSCTLTSGREESLAYECDFEFETRYGALKNKPIKPEVGTPEDTMTEETEKYGLGNEGSRELVISKNAFFATYTTQDEILAKQLYYAMELAPNTLKATELFNEGFAKNGYHIQCNQKNPKSGPTTHQCYLYLNCDQGIVQTPQFYRFNVKK
jgi:hypothetical protein